MTFARRICVIIGTLSWMVDAHAQTTLGELLDAGAKPLPLARFKEELVQRIISGPTASGGNIEIMYATNGTIEGKGLLRAQRTTPPAVVRGEWTTDELGRVCTSMVIYGAAATPGARLPSRCQSWFKLGDKYFFSDSDTDRSAKVLSRTIKQ